MYKLIVLALVAAVSCNDLIQGTEGGKKIYDENKEASPAIWKQTNAVTIKVNNTEVISRINITDLRADKDGEAKIVEGGQGQKNVTIELKSPTIFRGFNFHIEVYATEDGNQTDREEITEQVPVMENDTKVNPTKGEDSVTPKETDSVTGNPAQADKVEAPIITDRKSRNTDVTIDPIVQYVTENITEMGKVVTDKSVPFKSESLLLHNYPQFQDMTKHGLERPKVTKTIEAVTHKTNVASLHPHTLKEEESGFKTIVYKHEATPTVQSITVDYKHQTAPTVQSADTEIVTEHRNMKQFKDISKELGEHVVFGIKRV